MCPCLEANPHRRAHPPTPPALAPGPRASRASGAGGAAAGARRRVREHHRVPRGDAQRVGAGQRGQHEGAFCSCGHHAPHPMPHVPAHRSSRRPTVMLRRPMRTLRGATRRCASSWWRGTTSSVGRSWSSAAGARRCRGARSAQVRLTTGVARATSARGPAHQHPSSCAPRRGGGARGAGGAAARGPRASPAARGRGHGHGVGVGRRGCRASRGRARNRRIRHASPGYHCTGPVAAGGGAGGRGLDQGRARP